MKRGAADTKLEIFKDPVIRSKICLVIFTELNRQPGGLSMSSCKKILKDHPELGSLEIGDTDMPRILNNTRGVLVRSSGKELWAKLASKLVRWTSVA